MQGYFLLCLFLPVLIVCIAVGCSDSTGPEEEGEYTVLTPEDPQPGGDRVFGINPSESSEGFFLAAGRNKCQGAELTVPVVVTITVCDAVQYAVPENGVSQSHENS